MKRQHITLTTESMQLAEKQSDSNSVFFRGVAKTSAPVDRWFGALGFDFTNIQIPGSTNVLWCHKDEEPAVGQAKLALRDNQIYVESGEVYDSNTIKNAQAICELLKRGHDCKLSIGLSGDLEEYGKTKEIVLNGELQLVDAVLKNITVDEVSFVNSPADANAYAEKMQLKKKKDEKTKNEKNEVQMTLEELQAQLVAANTENERLKNEMTLAKLAAFATGMQVNLTADNLSNLNKLGFDGAKSVIEAMAKNIAEVKLKAEESAAPKAKVDLNKVQTAGADDLAESENFLGFDFDGVKLKLNK